MNYTKEDLRKFFLAGRRFGLTEDQDNTTMSFNDFFDVYSRIQDDITYVTYSDEEIVDTIKKNHLTEMMETDTKNGMYDQHKEQWRGWIDMKKIEEMKKRDEHKQTAVEWLVDQMLSEGHKEMWKDMIQQAKEMEKDQTEISDEEIAKSMSRYNITDFGQMAAYVTGAKWYREKLKSKQQ